ncbi:MAG: LemA family protein [Nitrospirota bacterium]
MELINILIIGSAIVLVLVLWVIVGVRHLLGLVQRIREEWEVVDESLRKRHDILPNLIETVRGFATDQESLLQDMIDKRVRAAKSYGASGKKIEYEHDLSKVIDKVIGLGRNFQELSKDTNFLELRKGIDDLEIQIEEKSKNYNVMVRYYNRHRSGISLRPLAAIWGLKAENIFEVEI